MTNLTDALHIPDTQSERDERHLPIQRVGVGSVRYPLALRVAGAVQTTTAEWALDVALPAERKGTHMSRFVAWLDALATDGAVLDAATLRARHAEMLQRLHADEGRVEAAFTFFLRKRAPVSGLASLLDYQGRWIAETRAGATTLWAEVAVPVKSLCPCSKEISDYGAHNQRSRVTIRVELLQPMEIEVAVTFKSLCPCSKEISDYGAHNQRSRVTIRVELLQPMEWHELVRFAEDEASSEIWPMLKRADEKWVTERAYENPKFVEDMVRDVALRLNREPRIGRYAVEVENFESIHNHSAYARIERA